MIEGYLRVCSNHEIKKIEESAIRILEKVGIKVPSDILLDCLESYGADINRAMKVAKFPPALIENTIRLQKEKRKNKKRNISKKNEFAQDFGYEAFFLYDWDKKERRRASRKDVIEMIHLGEVLEEVNSVGVPVLNSEIDQRIEAIEACELLYLHTNKHRGSGIRMPEQIKYIIEIDKILGFGPSNPHFVQTGSCMISPLNFGEDASRMFEELIKNGYTKKFSIGTMPLSGATSPVTIAGNVALAAAEILGGWAIIKAINKDADASAMIISGIMDMRTSKQSFAAPEAVLQDVCLWQFFKQLYGIEINYDCGYIDAKVPGWQAAYERAFRQMAFAMTSGIGLKCLKLGALDGASTFSPLQVMLDLDFNKGMWKFFNGVEINKDTIALDEILKIAHAERDTYLESEHTLMNFKNAIWYPSILDRTSWKGNVRELGREEKNLVAANDRWKELLKNYKPPVIDSDKAKAIHEVVEKAKKELLKN